MTTRTLDADAGQDDSRSAGEPPSAAGMIGPYRVIREAGSGGMGVVYEAIHSGTGRPAALKTVIDCNRALLAALRAEVIALRKVRHPYIVSILDEGLADASPWYAMDWIDGPTLAKFNASLWSTCSGGAGRREAAAGRLADVIGAYFGLCDALMHVHAQGIVHRDLKPTNVAFRGDGSPVLMDFGISSRAFGVAGRDQLDLTPHFMGSALYASPEQIRGEVVDPRADLYSLGCLLYETLTGDPPFLAAAPRQLMQKHLQEPPRAPSEVVDGIPPELDALVLSLLAKKPQDRIGHADDVMAALGHFAHLGASAPPPHRRFAGAPQPHLYRPGLVGRTKVLDGLRSGLASAKQGRGTAILVDGESGVGKTFLASEIARWAGLDMFQLVTGECKSVAADGAGADLATGYLYPFRNLLLTVADRCREGDHAFAGGPARDAVTTLAPYEPALEPFTYGPAAHSRGLPPDAVRLRILGALAEVLRTCSLECPLLLVLDDLQWADELSLHFLQSLPQGFFGDLPILFVGFFRSEGPARALELLLARTDVGRFGLERLSQDELVSMTRDMLAMATPPETLIRFLVRRSGGNPFVAGEYLRLFAEERILRRSAGSWVLAEDLETSDPSFERLALPSSVRDLVARRLARLRPDDATLVEAAAVLGHEFDEGTLAAVVGAEESSLAGSLWDLQAAQILMDAGPTRHRFAHDHLRGAAYDRIAPERRRALHAATAAALETRGAPVSTGRLAEVAHHFKEARDWPKATTYLERAAEHALATFANLEAVRLFRDLLEVEAVAGAGTASTRRARWERGLGDALHGSGRLDESRKHLEASLALYGEPPPDTKARLAWSTTTQLLEQAARRMPVGPSATADAEERGRLLEASQAYDRLLQIAYYRGDQLGMLHATLKSLNFSERAGPAPELARAYAIAHAVAGTIPLRWLAEAYLERATETLQKTPDSAVESYLLLLTGGYRAGIAEWELSLLAFERGLQIASALAFHRRCDEIRLGLGNWFFLRGRYDEATPEVGTDLASAMRGDPQADAWRLLVRAQVRLVQGRLAEAAVLSAQVEAFATKLERSERMWSLALAALVAFRRGDAERAEVLAADALREICAGPPVTFYCIEAYSAVCDVYLSLWERARSLGLSEGRLPGRAAKACSALRAFARVFPAATPRWELHEGTRRRQKGQRPEAFAHWKRSLEAAIDLRMPLDETKASWRLAREGDESRRLSDGGALDLTGVLRAADALGAGALAQRLRDDIDRGLPQTRPRK